MPQTLKVESDDAAGGVRTGPILLSINRFERKKDIALALRAFALLLEQLPHDSYNRATAGSKRRGPLSGKASCASSLALPHLVIAGGYDTRVAENVEYYLELVQLARELGLLGDSPRVGDIASLIPSWPAASASAAGTTQQVAYEQVLGGAHVTFVRSFTDEQKSAMLRAAAAVVYTPSREHFGIVPLECMSAGRPVIAVASGGPLESVVDGETGILCEPTPAVSRLVCAMLAGGRHCVLFCSPCCDNSAHQQYHYSRRAPSTHAPCNRIGFCARHGHRHILSSGRCRNGVGWFPSRCCCLQPYSIR